MSAAACRCPFAARLLSSLDHHPTHLAVSILLQSSQGYIGEFEFVDDHLSVKIVVEFNGRLNKWRVISPCFDVSIKEIDSWTVGLLPSRQFGYIVLPPLLASRTMKRRGERIWEGRSLASLLGLGKSLIQS